MKQFSKFGFIFTFIYLYGFKESYAESIIECKNVICPELQSNFECPSDSRPLIYDPVITNTNDIHNFNNFYSENARIRRSVQFTRRESIKIVPGGYISKRSINADDEIIERCCPVQKCICNPCDMPVCELNEIIILNNTAEMDEGGIDNISPGNCCPNYECHENLDCSQYDDGYEWIQPCLTCRCIDNETFCHITCNDEIQTTCKSTNLHPLKIYRNGEQWMDDSCTTCTCINGYRHCVATICDSLTCHNKIRLPNECCPKCDYNVTTHFCPDAENCDIVCQYDYVKSDNGCSTCKCMPATTVSTSTTTSTTTTTTTTTTTPVPPTTSTSTTTTPTTTTVSPVIDVTETNDNNYSNINDNNNNNNNNDITNSNIKLIDQIHLENNENYFYYFSFSFILNLILFLIIIYLCYTIVTLKSHQKYDIIDSSLDSNLNEIVSTKFIRKY